MVYRGPADCKALDKDIHYSSVAEFDVGLPVVVAVGVAAAGDAVAAAAAVENFVAAVVAYD